MNEQLIDKLIEGMLNGKARMFREAVAFQILIRAMGNMRVTTYEKVKKNAEHYAAIGDLEIYLDGDIPDLPWHLATEMTPGGTHRLDITTSVRFGCFDTEAKLILNWSFDIELRGANGEPGYKIDTEGCAKILRQLNPDIAKQFKEYLNDCASAVKKKGDDYKKAADKQYADADILRGLSQL